MADYWDVLYNNLLRQTADYFWKETNVIYRSELLAMLESILENIKDHDINTKTVSIQTDTNISQFLCILAVGKCGGIPCPLGFVNTDSNYSQSFDYELVFSKDVLDLSKGASIIDTPSNSNFEICMGYSTSGTSSGSRKVVFQTHKQLVTTEKAINERMSSAETNVELVATPFDNAYWFGRIRCLLAKDTRIIFSPHPINPIKITQIMENEIISGISCDTPLFIALSKFADRKNANTFKTLNYIKVASAPIDTEYVKYFYSSGGKSKIFYNYGLTEAMRCCILVLPNQLEKIGSVGRPLNGVNIKILDDDNNPIENPMVVGQVATSGDHLSHSYNDEILWKKQFTNGYFKTKDVGYIDTDGFLFILGRNDDAINRGGKIIHPTEIEACISDELSCAFCIVGKKNHKDNFDEVPFLIVEDANFDQNSFLKIKQKVLRKCGRQCVPVGYYQVPKIPKTQNGKIQRSLIKDWFNNV